MKIELHTSPDRRGATCILGIEMPFAWGGAFDTSRVHLRRLSMPPAEGEWMPVGDGGRGSFGEVTLFRAALGVTLMERAHPCQADEGRRAVEDFGREGRVRRTGLTDLTEAELAATAANLSLVRAG